jgi:hypothetical protein
VKSARERPSAYTTPRKKLQQQAVDKADRWGVDSYILPVFSEKSVRSEIIEEAVAHVRECGKNRLRDRWALVNAAVGAVEGEDNSTRATYSTRRTTTTTPSTSIARRAPSLTVITASRGRSLFTSLTDSDYIPVTFT